MRTPLPIDQHLEQICQSVETHPISIVEAAPGTGKTTRVAAALLERPFLNGRKVYLLQPRRLAAKSVSQRIAWEHGSRLGETIGYQVRFESKVSRNTQLIVVTDGVLLRRLQDDPSIEDTAVVVMDEFHERSLNSDLLLGMLGRIQSVVRSDLRLVIMSATIDSDLVRSQLEDAPVIRVPSKQFPVDIRYRPPLGRDHMTDHVVKTLQEVVPKHDGDVLVFLPGAGEINRCLEALSQTPLARELDVLPLYGAMQLEEQSRAIETGPKRRIVLATNVAETSLTIEGVRVVVDSGTARVLRFSPEVGLDRLAIEGICQASSTQRAGRAGRVAPGVCYRLWTEASERSRSAFLEPEIRRVDIVSATLQLYAWGEGESDDFPWLERPRSESLAYARNLLQQLNAIDHGRITAIGKWMASIPTHPRLSRMLLASYWLGCVERACTLAALLSERDPFDRRSTRDIQSGGMHSRAMKRWDSDCIERLVAMEEFDGGRRSETPFGTLHRGSIQSIKNVASQLLDQCNRSFNATQMEAISDQIMFENPKEDFTDSDHSMDADERLMRAMLFGFPDRLAKRRAPGKPNALMVGGKGVALSHQSGVTESELFLCIDVEAGAGDASVRQASRVDLDWLPTSQLVERDELFFHPSQKQVVARRRLLWQDLVLSETPTSVRDEDQCAQVLWQSAIKHWDQAFPKDDERLNGLVARIKCLKQWLPELELPDIEDSFFQEVAKELCRSRRSLSELRSAPWLDWVQTRFSSQQWQAIEREAPVKIQVPSGSWINVQYDAGKPPVVAVKIQEVFSWRATPRIAMGRVPILLHLLAPNMRPQQITDDLSSFWVNGYPIVRKELKRRYPKHAWPDDPTTATPGRK